jgi:hypothetical protein
MTGLVNDVRSLENILSEEKGRFALFALFLPADSANQWDLIVSAPWAHIDDRETLDLLTTRLKESVDPSSRLLVARVVVVDPGNADVQKINSVRDVEHELIEVKNEEHFGYEVQQGYIITSKDYWSFIKRLFPRNADFDFYKRDGDLCIGVSWLLNDDPARPNKRSRGTVIRISREALDDYLYVDDHDPRRLKSQERLAGYIADRLRNFDPRHDREWRVRTTDFHDTRALA